jgi:hypothetical protein
MSVHSVCIVTLLHSKYSINRKILCWPLRIFVNPLEITTCTTPPLINVFSIWNPNPYADLWEFLSTQVSKIAFTFLSSTPTLTTLWIRSLSPPPLPPPLFFAHSAFGYSYICIHIDSHRVHTYVYTCICMHPYICIHIDFHRVHNVPSGASPTT